MKTYKTETSRLAAAHATEMELKGSEKQVAWAEKIRSAVFADLAKFPADALTNPRIAAAIAELEAEPSAAWWIDNGQGGARSAIRAIDGTTRCPKCRANDGHGRYTADALPHHLELNPAHAG